MISVITALSMIGAAVVAQYVFDKPSRRSQANARRELHKAIEKGLKAGIQEDELQDEINSSLRKVCR